MCPDNSYIVLKITVTYTILIVRHKLDRWFNPTLGSYVIYVSFETNIFSFVLARFKSLQINLREGFKKKRKKSVEFSTTRYLTPPPVKLWKFILFSFDHFSRRFSTF